MSLVDPQGWAMPEEHTLVLERLRHVASTALSPALVATLETHTFEHTFRDQLIMQLRAEVLGHRLVNEEASGALRVIVTYPASGWDAFKRDAAPRLGRLGRWWLRRHPVRLTARVVREAWGVTFREWATFPEASIVYPRELGAVHVRQSASITFGDGPPEEVPTRKIWPHEQAIADGAVKVLHAVGNGRSVWEALGELDPEVRRALNDRIREEANRR